MQCVSLYLDHYFATCAAHLFSSSFSRVCSHCLLRLHSGYLKNIQRGPPFVPSCLRRRDETSARRMRARKSREMHLRILRKHWREDCQTRSAGIIRITPFVYRKRNARVRNLRSCVHEVRCRKFNVNFRRNYSQCVIRHLRVLSKNQKLFFKSK